MKNLSEEKCRVFRSTGGEWTVQMPLCFDKTFESGRDALAFMREVLERVGK